MGTSSKLSIWILLKPEKPPEFPKSFNFSLLNEIELCPKKWFLSNSKYSNLDKSQNYYPYTVNLKAIKGSIIHLTFNKILRLFINESCYSTQDPKVRQLLEKEGGLSNLVSKEINNYLDRMSSNPRFKINSEVYSSKIKENQNDILLAVKHYFGVINFSNVSRTQIKFNRDNSNSKKLKNGIYSELVLSNNDYDFRGILDLFIIDHDTYTITDFKTGEPRDYHVDQIRFYSLLWYLDKVHNPLKKIVNKLILIYQSNELHYDGLSKKDLMELLEQVNSKIKTVQTDINNENFIAKYSKDKCPMCHVRQLCKDYWTNTNRMNYEVNRINGFIDLEIKILNELTTETFNIMISNNYFKSLEYGLILRNNYNVWKFEKNIVYRILNAGINIDSVNKIVFINVNYNTEIFTLN